MLYRKIHHSYALLPHNYTSAWVKPPVLNSQVDFLVNFTEIFLLLFSCVPIICDHINARQVATNLVFREVMMVIAQELHIYVHQLGCGSGSESRGRRWSGRR